MLMLSVQVRKFHRLVLIGMLLLAGFSGIMLTFHFVQAAHAVHIKPGNGSPNDANIRYFGRWDSSSTTDYTSYWSGAYFKTDFTGTTIRIDLAGSADIYADIDNDGDVYYPDASGIVNLTPIPLPVGIHSLLVASRSQNDVIQFQGLLLDARAHTLPPLTSPDLIEFVGDSITAGFTDTKYALSAYPWLVGERLHVEHTQIAYPGICLVDHVRCLSADDIGMSRQFFKLQTPAYLNSPDWDFSRYQPRVVVINIGTNDALYHVDPMLFQSTYITFLRNIRHVYPHAIMLVLRTFGGFMVAPTLAAVHARIAAGDRNVHYINTTGWLLPSGMSDRLHPNDAGHSRIANLLAPIVSSYLPMGA
jgi:lysophospholipase L1-like esterase